MSCGGLCPGINVVIRELVMALRYNYGVPEIYGIKWGFLGFTKKDCWVKLNPDDVKEIHLLGGTVLGTSRSGFDGEEISKQLIKNNVNMVFFIGGDGTHRGIKELSRILKEKKKKIVLVGIPKSIDNDMPIIDKSFGLESAIQESVRTIRAANVEANCNLNGIGLVKLFGQNKDSQNNQDYQIESKFQNRQEQFTTEEDISKIKESTMSQGIQKIEMF